MRKQERRTLRAEAGPGTGSAHGNSEIPTSTTVYLSYGQHFKFKQNYYAQESGTVPKQAS